MIKLGYLDGRIVYVPVQSKVDGKEFLAVFGMLTALLIMVAHMTAPPVGF